MKLALLVCDHIPEKYHHTAKSYTDLFRELFAQIDPAISIEPFYVIDGNFPHDLNQFDGFVTTGSRHAVYDDPAWVKRLRDFTGLLYKQERKHIGVCYGHQMIAQALGGRVRKSSGGWGAGVKPMAIYENQRWMQPVRDSFKLHYMHQDQIELLPPGARILAGNEHCPIGMMTVGDHFLGIQGHPEFTRDYVEALLQDRVALIGKNQVDRALNSLSESPDARVVAEWMLRFF